MSRDVWNTINNAGGGNTYQLVPEQLEGIAFLENQKRVLLADDVGVGKTAQAVVAAEKSGESTLVFTKKTLLHQWCSEVKLWTHSSAEDFTVASDALPNTNFVITNYDTVLRRNDILTSRKWDTIIIDEATAIKNRKAKRSKELEKLARTTPQCYLLTGTPIHNRPDELWNLLHTLNRKEFSSYWAFVFAHCETSRDFMGHQIIGGVKDQEALARVIAPYFIRRDSSVLGLREPTHDYTHLQLPLKQRKVYREMQELFMTMIESTIEAEGGLIIAPNVLARMMRLRQLACAPLLLGGSDAGVKADALLEYMEDTAPYHKVVVFTTFIPYAELLVQKLQAYNPALITGETNRKEVVVNGKRITKTALSQETLWNDESCRVAICGMDAAGEGLNLQCADRVVFMDFPWVPKTITQCIGRVQRRRQVNPVHVTYFVADDTIDEYIISVLEEKQGYIHELEAVNAIIKQMRMVV